MTLSKEFFMRDRLEVARDMVGKLLVVRHGDELTAQRITETEAYGFEDDTACHAHKGRTKRTEVLYMEGGTIYVYLCYGIHWLLNIVTGAEDSPQAVLIRACEDAEGPGRLTKKAYVDGSFNRLEANEETGLWLEDDGRRFEVLTGKRIGIDYADEADRDRLWRFIMGKELQR